jgi:hypothetical protein
MLYTVRLYGCTVRKHFQLVLQPSFSSTGRAVKAVPHRLCKTLCNWSISLPPHPPLKKIDYKKVDLGESSRIEYKF